MSERQDPEKYLILFKVLVVFNILYYAHEIKSLVGMMDLFPTDEHTYIGLVVRLGFALYIINTVLLLHCLFINHWYVVFFYVLMLVVQLILAMAIDNLMFSGYHIGQTVWGGGVLLFYLLYRWILHLDDKIQTNE